MHQTPWNTRAAVTLVIVSFLSGCSEAPGLNSFEDGSQGLEPGSVEEPLSRVTLPPIIPATKLPLPPPLPPEPPPEPGEGDAWEGQTGQIGSRWLYLAGGQTVTLATTNCTAGTDPVLHLFDLYGGEVAADDSSAVGPYSRIVLTPSSTGWFRLVTRAASNDSHGVCDIVKDNATIYTGLPFGGMFVRMPGLRQGEVLETVQLPGGIGPNHYLYIFQPDGVHVHTVARHGGVNGATRYVLPLGLGTRWVMVAPSVSSEPGRIRVVRNDLIAGHDVDGDGLGYELEGNIGTCSDLAGIAKGFDCSLAVDARDTDGDGISDGWEYLGRGDKYPQQSLPAWGANPRHKDLFVELDFMQKYDSDADRKLSPERARKFASYYQAEVPELSPLRVAYNAAVLRNPDKAPGIAVHLDTGMEPADPSDETLYGNWGGHNAVAPAAPGVGQSAGAAWQSEMVESRRGIFHYALGYSGSGGSCGHHVIACSLPLDDAKIAAHEFGHTLGIAHSGPAHLNADPNCKPNYPSIMNYGYLDELMTDGYVVDDVGFHDGVGRPALDNTALRERSNSYDDRYMDHLEHVFQYNVDREHGHVDWNRDGLFSEGTVEGYANYTPEDGGGCEWTRYNQVSVGAQASGSPALVRVEHVTYVLYPTPATTLGYALSHSPFDCPEASSGCNGATFSDATDLGGDVRAVDAVRINEGGQNWVLAVTVSSDGMLREHKFLPWGFDGTLVEVSNAEIVASPVDDEPTLEVLPDGSVMVGYKGTDRFFYTQRRVAGVWLGEVSAEDSGGNAIGGLFYDASPSLAWVRVPQEDTQRPEDFAPGLYAAVTKGSWVGAIYLYRYDETTATWGIVVPWERPSWGLMNPVGVRGRPAMAYDSGDPTVGRPPRFYLAYMGNNGAVKMQVSHAVGVGSSAVQRVGLDGLFDNAWYVAHGIDLMFESGVDTNLRSVAAFASGNPALDGTLDFRPNADGITQYPLIGHNDWEVLRVDLCRVVAQSAGDANPISCPAWVW